MATVSTMTYPDITVRSNPVATDLFEPKVAQVETSDGSVTVTVPPFSVCWLEL